MCIYLETVPNDLTAQAVKLIARIGSRAVDEAFNESRQRSCNTSSWHTRGSRLSPGAGVVFNEHPLPLMRCSWGDSRAGRGFIKVFFDHQLLRHIAKLWRKMRGIAAQSISSDNASSHIVGVENNNAYIIVIDIGIKRA